MFGDENRLEVWIHAHVSGRYEKRPSRQTITVAHALYYRFERVRVVIFEKHVLRGGLDERQKQRLRLQMFRQQFDRFLTLQYLPQYETFPNPRGSTYEHVLALCYVTANKRDFLFVDRVDLFMFFLFFICNERIHRRCY